LPAELSSRAAGLSFADLELGRYTRMTYMQKLLQAGQLDSSLRWSNQHVETAV
jgi:hypothetical protein